MLPLSSRFYRASTRTLHVEGTTRTVLGFQRRPVFTGSYQSMVWTTNSRIDWVAYNKYKDETLWWVIADANPSVTDWTDVRVGSLIRLPNVRVVS